MMKYNAPLAAAFIFSLTATPVFAQSAPINYDALSFVEEPLAVDLGGATLSVNGLVDQSIEYDTATNDDSYNTRALAEINLETQLGNSWLVGLTYNALYNRLAADEYTDNFAAFISDEWGTLAGGNVTGSVFELTRRLRGVGNANLANDNFIGALDETGGFYSVQYNSYLLSLTADLEGQFETGLSFERPIGKASYFASSRFRVGNGSENPNFGTDADTYGGAIVGGFTYGSFSLDGQFGYESLDRGIRGTADHYFSSLGTRYKFGAYAISLEGGLGRFDNIDRRAASLGARLDIARGASLNLGVNYVFVDDNDVTTGLTSLRYEF